MDDQNPYDIWFKQSQTFFKSAETYLKNYFDSPMPFNPEQNQQIIQQWLDALKAQWQQSFHETQPEPFAQYWKNASQLCNEATDLMLNEWIKRNRENTPIENIRELYELWIQCCHQVYERAMQTKSYQETFGKFMNDALKFWSKYSTPV